MEVCFLLFSSYIVPVFCSRSVIMQKRNAIFSRYALAGGLARVPCGCCAFLRGLCSCEVSRPTRFYYVTLTLNPSPRGRDLPSPSGLQGSRSLAGGFVRVPCGGCAFLRVLCSCEVSRPTRFYYVTLTLNPSPRGRDLPSPFRL